MTVDPSDDLVSFLQTNFDSSVVSVSFSTSSDIDHANYEGPNDYPQVAVVSEDPFVLGGGVTGFTGIDPDGDGPVQDVIVEILVDCWGGPETETVYQNNDVHPDTVATELAHEVWQTCNDAAAADSPSGYAWVSADPPRDADDTDRQQTHYRQQVVCRLKHRHSP